MMDLRYEAACGCNTGLVRLNNEDNFYFGGLTLAEEHNGLPDVETGEALIPVTRPRRGFAMAVFDGMGGESDGQVASGTAVEVFRRRFTRIDAETTEKFLRSVIHDMNDAVAKKAVESCCSMGTTVAVLCFMSDDYYVCNVGDSKVFLMRDNELNQISEDHTDAAVLRRLGIQNRKPRLSQYIGMKEKDVQISPFISVGKVYHRDQYLLCSDGLTDMVQQEEVEYIMKKTFSAEECVEELIKAALAHGGKDNVTVINIRVRND